MNSLTRTIFGSRNRTDGSYYYDFTHANGEFKFSEPVPMYSRIKLIYKPRNFVNEHHYFYPFNGQTTGMAVGMRDQGNNYAAVDVGSGVDQISNAFGYVQLPTIFNSHDFSKWVVFEFLINSATSYTIRWSYEDGGAIIEERTIDEPTLAGTDFYISTLFRSQTDETNINDNLSLREFWIDNHHYPMNESFGRSFYSNSIPNILRWSETNHGFTNINELRNEL